MTLPPRAAVSRWAARLLFAAGGVCLGLALLGWAEALVFQWVLDWRLERALNEGAGAPAPSTPAAAGPVAAPAADGGEGASASALPDLEPASAGAAARGRSEDSAPDSSTPIGRLVAPRLGLTAVVAEGISSRTLRRAVGHIPGTALPWEDGTVGLAAHRDTFFRRLQEVRVGDTFRLVTPRGRFEYVVRSLDIVSPERADLLDAAETSRLTLVTCYPFTAVGPAPSRFVVTADRVDAPPVRKSRAALWKPLAGD